MYKHPTRTILAVLLTLILCAAAAVPALAAGADAGDVQPHGGLLVLTLDNTDTAGPVIRGLWAGTTPIPNSTLLGLLREATAENAAFVDADTGEELPPDAPAATGCTARWTDENGSHDAALVVMGDVLGTGTIGLSQLTRVAAALYKEGSSLEGAYYLAGCVSGGGTLSLTDLVAEAQMYTDTPSISAAEQARIIGEAVALQTSGGSYKADVFTVTELHKGDVIFGMLPGQSAFYTDMATVEACGGSYLQMYARLQMLPHPEFGYREELGSYTVLEDTWAACGYCLANEEIGGVFAGNGGGFQYVIPDYETILELTDTADLHESAAGSLALEALCN